jgi:hypothetical protein
MKFRTENKYRYFRDLESHNILIYVTSRKPDVHFYLLSDEFEHWSFLNLNYILRHPYVFRELTKQEAKQLIPYIP